MPTSKIRNGMIILLFCYSKTVINYLIQAKLQGKNFTVIAMETRPNFTGRMTVKALLKLKIPTTLVTDMVGLLLIPTTNFILIGADIIAKNGDIINKVGTSVLCQLANLYHIPVYCCADSSKYVQENYPTHQTIKTRPLREVFTKTLKGLTVLNPAYDVTERKKITGVLDGNKEE